MGKFKNPWGEGGFHFPDHIGDTIDRWFNNHHSDEDQSDKKFLSSSTTKKVAIAFYGGAKKVGDNGAFKQSAKNTQASYASVYKNLMYFAKSAKYIVDTIADQDDSTIGRLDIVTHASATACYIVRNEDTQETGESVTIPDDKAESNNLYASSTTKFIESWGGGADQRTIYDIDFNKFANDSVVELHGCKVATDTYEYVLDNLAENISEELYSKEKKKAVVIGHTTKANPSINGDKTTTAAQDYRHGERAVYHNGSILFKTKEARHIGKDVINIYLKKKADAEAANKVYNGNSEVYKK